MSYDLYLWRLKPGMTLDDARGYFAAEDAAEEDPAKDVEELELLDEEGDDSEDEESDDEFGDEDDDDSELPPFVDADFDEDQAFLAAIKPLLRTQIPASQTSPALASYLRSNTPEPPPDDFMNDGAEAWAQLLGEACVPGGISFTFNEGEALEDTFRSLWPFLKEMADQGFVIFDPQNGELVDPTLDADAFIDSVRNGQNFFDHVMSSLGGVMGGMGIEQIQTIKTKLEEGDEFAQKSDFDSALASYKEAWDAIPEPREEFMGTSAVAGAVGQIHLIRGDLQQALSYFETGLRCAGSEEDALLQLLAGQTLFHLDRAHEAAPLLARAFELEGEELFEGEDPALLALAKGTGRKG